MEIIASPNGVPLRGYHVRMSTDTNSARPEVAEIVTDTRRIDTQFECDLGITGDDGVELLEAVQERFRVTFTDGENGLRTIFNPAPNEYLFNSEGFSIGLGGTDIITLFSNPNADYSVRSFTQPSTLSWAVRR